MDRLLILLGIKKPPLPDTGPNFPPLPADDDINSKGLTQYFNLSLNKEGATASVINDNESGEIVATASVINDNESGEFVVAFLSYHKNR